MAEYHKYVFNIEKREFVGKFEEMYQAEKEKYFDSWHQEDMRTLSKKICLDILEQYSFSRILDMGCGKGAFTHLIKKYNNEVTGIDISETALKYARERYPDINFIIADLTINGWDNFPIFKEKNFDCIVIMELISYLENWKDMIRKLSTMTEYMLISLFIPENPIGFVKSREELLEVFKKFFNCIEEIDIVNRKTIVLFGSSKNGNKGD